MPITFKPKTEEEVLADQLCPEGLHPFTILESSEVLSKSQKNAGRAMIKLKLNIHSSDGFDYHVYDYAADWFMGHKFRHLFHSIGLGQSYESGRVNAADNQLKDRQGWAHVGIQKSKNGYPPKNVISDYSDQDEGNQPAAPKHGPENSSPVEATEEDDVPF